MVKKHKGAAAEAESNKVGRSAEDATAKGGAKAVTKEQHAAVLAKEVAAGKKQARDEIDDLFGGLKAAKKQKAAADAAAAAEEPAGDKSGKGGSKKEGKQKVEGSKDDLFGTEAARGRKRTEEGFAIYGEEELGLGKKGGNTPLCPFDCDCCF